MSCSSCDKFVINLKAWNDNWSTAIGKRETPTQGKLLLPQNKTDAYCACLILLPLYIPGMRPPPNIIPTPHHPAPPTQFPISSQSEAYSRLGKP